MSEPKLANTPPRWLISGRLLTLSRLHLGSGSWDDSRPEWKAPSRKGAPGLPIQFNAVQRDHRGRPVIPGSSIKGSLRACAATSKLHEEDYLRWERMLGSLDPEAADALGGAVTFFDCRVQDDFQMRFTMADRQAGREPPRWVDSLLTGVAASVAISRKTRTSAPAKLFHTEFVPPQVPFHLRCWAEGLDDDDVRLLLAALEAFNCDENPRLLGANGSNGWGRMKWLPAEVLVLEPKGLASWLGAGAPTSGCATVRAYGRSRTDLLPPRLKAVVSPDLVRLPLLLEFDGPFLVNRMDADARGAEKAKEKGERIHFSPRLDETGRVVLDPESIRGVLRSRGEKILRTLCCQPESEAPDPSTPMVESFAGFEPSRESTAPPTPAESAVLQEALSLAGRIFGAGGWKSGVQIAEAFRSDQAAVAFDPESAQSIPANVPILLRQELVAVDRFTCGVAKKFTGQYAWRPVLRGVLALDRTRWRTAGVELAGEALLALVLRDLRDGDLTFGFGASRGYGAVRASPANNPEFSEWLGSQGVALALAELRRQLQPTLER